MTQTVDTLDEAQAASVAATWVRAFGDAVHLGADADIEQLFVADCWWRDLLLADWDLSTAHGADDIRRLLACASGLDLRTSQDDGATASFVAGPTASWIEATFNVCTSVSAGRALVRLVDDPDSSGGWRAWTLFTAIESLHEVDECVGPQRPFGGKQARPRTPLLGSTADDGEDSTDPKVVIVGAGQAGLSVAARLNALGIPNLVLERHARTGDNWRRRYGSLVLHDPVWSDHLPYLRFPPTWPLYMSKDQLGDWLELYAAALDIQVATNSCIVDCRYEDQRWQIQVQRDGEQLLFRPRHLVIATGATSGKAIRPALSGEESFRGAVLHSSEYVGPEGLTGERVLVVGTGNSGHDIAQDLAEAGKTVTMLQRSSTYVTAASNVLLLLAPLFGEAVTDLDDSDFRAASFPFGAAKPMHQFATKMMADNDHDMLEGLRRSGFALSFGREDTGLTSLFHERGGGYYLDVGAAQLIADGQIKVKQGSIARLTEQGVTFEDGSDLEVDTIILATGFQPMSESLRAIVGDKITDQCRPRWGLDENGELRSVWRPSVQPGLWFAGGNLSICRYYSKFLALHITAIENGLTGADPEYAKTPR
jgi:putative flavoprotein involved in K+ transport